VHIRKLISLATDLFVEEDNILLVDSPVTICGDIHGKFYDMFKLFDNGGDPKETTYLFLGDYVDRGYFSMEVIILLYAYKVYYPKTILLLRGNHECRHLTEFFTFKEECSVKYDEDIYNHIMDSFDALPLVAIVNKQFFCVHGGISPELKSLDDINNIHRMMEPPPSGPLCDLLWADPMDYFGPNVDSKFVFNTTRGCSYYYSYNAVCNFLETNNLLCIIRAHEVQDPGYRMHRKIDKTGFPSVITLFSAPNYCETYNNKGAILRYENGVINIKQYSSSTQPYVLPGFINGFEWSLPFLAEKVGEILLGLYNIVDDKKLELLTEKENTIKAKILTISKMLAIYKNIRREREKEIRISKLIRTSNLTLSGRLRALKKSEIKRSFSFEGSKSIDLPNEARPPHKEIDYVIKFSSIPTLRRKISLDTLLKDEPLKPTPKIVEQTEVTKLTID